MTSVSLSRQGANVSADIRMTDLQTDASSFSGMIADVFLPKLSNSFVFHKRFICAQPKAAQMSLVSPTQTKCFWYLMLLVLRGGSLIFFLIFIGACDCFSSQWYQPSCWRQQAKIGRRPIRSPSCHLSWVTARIYDFNLRIWHRHNLKVTTRNF